MSDKLVQQLPADCVNHWTTTSFVECKVGDRFYVWIRYDGVLQFEPYMAYTSHAEAKDRIKFLIMAGDEARIGQPFALEHSFTYTSLLTGDKVICNHPHWHNAYHNLNGL